MLNRLIVCAEKELLALAVGDIDGACEGACDGDSEGACDGNSEGAAESQALMHTAILDHPAAFTMAEMVDSSIPNPPECFHNLLYRGGDLGGHHAILFHSDERLAKLADS